MKLSNIFRAWLSTVIGLLIPIMTGLVTQIATGKIDWSAVKYSLIGTGILALTDLLGEIKKALDGTSNKGNGPLSVILLFLWLSFAMSGCSLFKANCKIDYSAPVTDFDSSSYICLKCKNALILQGYDSLKVHITPKLNLKKKN